MAKKTTPPELAEGDLTPLLQATASRSLDTCLRGARGLAVLGDPRAFGLLLQLSREADPTARVEVCKALAALQDPRAADRLRSLLYDAEAAVRDAAFTALAKLQSAQPLQYATAGLNAAFEDVRRRGLEALVRYLRETPQEGASAGPALELLARALNDSAAAVRNEAFKAALNLQASGGGLHTLRFIKQSHHADVRQEVLTEAMAQIQQPWAWNLLLEFYNDPEPTLRHEAFTTAVGRNKDLPPLQTALLSHYPDVRRLAVEALIKKHTPEAQKLLVEVLIDADRDVRQKALGALVGREPLVEALASPHADIRVRAGRALARIGDRSALGPLLALATAAEPREAHLKADWLALAEAALEGLAELGDADSLSPLVPLLQSEHASLRKLTAKAITWAALPHHVETLRQALMHNDPQVKYHAALGLAYAGDPLVASLVFSDQAAQVLTPADRLVAALLLGRAGDDQLAVFLDAADDTRNRALLLMMLLELAGREGAPVRCLTCLSARPPRVRLAAARALERFADPATFRDYVVQLVNDRGDEPAWKSPVNAETVTLLAQLVASGPPAVRARTTYLLRHLSEKEPHAWEQAWSLHVNRFAADIQALREAVKERKPAASLYTPQQLHELAFGAYIGLVREQGGSTTAGYGTESQVVRVRQTALSRLQDMAAGGHTAAVIPVFVQALSDPNKDVRMQAFDQLAALGLDAETLGAAALGAGHTDIGVRGLEKLAGGGNSPEGQAVLEEALKNRTDDLATEAAKLLAARRGLVPVAELSLAAEYEPLRKQAVDWLAAEYDKAPAARDQLRQALQSRHRKVVAAAAFALAVKKDAAAFDALVKLLGDAKEEGVQRRLIDALKELGDPRTPDAFLDRLEQEKEAGSLIPLLCEAAGSFRRPAVADRLLRLCAGPLWGEQVFQAAVVVSGFDQPIEDSEDEKRDRTWESKQHPRHPVMLARLLQRGIDLKRPHWLTQLLSGARWARGSEVDPVLGLLTVHADDSVRHAAVEAVAWRLRKRGGPAEPLVKALKHRDPVTQFLAAEGLCRGKREEGLSVVLAAVELQEDYSLRQRAVQALGELGNPRALDLLLKIVNDPEHTLRNEAAEAVGHMRRSEKAHEILELLLSLVRGGGPVADGALRGLRWFDHPDGWQLIRRRAADTTSQQREVAIELLGHNDDPATRDLLLKLLAGEHEEWLLEAVIASARKLWGEDALEPDIAVLRNPVLDEGEREALFRRLKERGDARRLLEILPKVPADVAPRIKNILLSRQPPPVAEAKAAVAGPDAAVAGMAAHLLGRSGDAESGPAVAAALERWWREWDRGRQEEQRRGAWAGRLVGHLLEPLRTLAWAAGRLGVATDSLIAAASARSDSMYDRPLRRDAVAALAAGHPGDAVLGAMEKLAAGDDPEIRATAAAVVAREGAARAAAVASHVLSDRVAFNRAAGRAGDGLADTLRTTAGQVHYQGVVVPHLAGRRDVKSLAAVANDGSLTEAARLGAVEGLAASVSEDAEAELKRIAGAGDQPEEVRKAAGRGLRRSRRARSRQRREVTT